MTNISMKKLVRYRHYQSNVSTGELYCGDAFDFLGRLDSESASIVFLDPPFNLGKEYSDGKVALDDRHPDDYYLWMTSILEESIRILAEGGALYLYHLPVWAMRFGSFLADQLEFRHWIAIAMKNGFARGNNLYPAHYALLYFTKGSPLYFSRPKIEPAICRHCGGTGSGRSCQTC